MRPASAGQRRELKVFAQWAIEGKLVREGFRKRDGNEVCNVVRLELRHAEVMGVGPNWEKLRVHEELSKTVH